jgi:hypothetical protein
MREMLLDPAQDRRQIRIQPINLVLASPLALDEAAVQ